MKLDSSSQNSTSVQRFQAAIVCYLLFNMWRMKFSGGKFAITSVNFEPSDRLPLGLHDLFQIIKGQSETFFG